MDVKNLEWQQRVTAGITGLGICTLDVDGCVASWNAGCQSITGYAADEILGQHFAAFYEHQAQVARAPQGALAAAAELGVFTSEGWRMRRDGTRYWALVILNAVRDDDGTLLGFAEITRDGTAERVAAEELLRSERSFRLLIQGVTDYAIYMLDVNGRVASWNAGAERAKGYREDEILGRHFSCFYTPEDQARGKPADALETARTRGTFETEDWRVGKDGTRFWAVVVIDPVYDEEGALIGYAKITRDCTDRNRAEQERRLSEESFRLLVQSVTDYAIYMLDPEGRVANWNDGAASAKGYAADEIIGQHFSIFYDEDDRAAGKPARALAAALENGKFEATGWRYRKDGSRFWADVVIDPIYDQGRHVGFAKVTRDVTRQKEDRERLDALIAEQRATLERLEISAAEAKQASIAKSAFLANMSHEIRTPLNGVIGMAELLLDGGLGGRERMFAESIASSGEALLGIINDILDFSKIESEKLELRPEAFDLRTVIDDIAAMIDVIAGRNGVEVMTRYDPDLPGGLVADPLRLRQVITNLAGNAAKFTASGHILIHAASTPLGDGRCTLRVEVADTGIGIAQDKLDLIFEEFSQAETTTTRFYGGTGLGLTISRRLVELMGGRIQVASRLGEGSTFTIELPLHVAEGFTGEVDTGRALPPARVLVVDDVTLNRDIMAEQCARWGLQATCVASGPEAIAALEGAARAGAPFDLVLLDYHMPGMDGLEVAERMKARPEFGRATIVVLSSGDDDASISAFRDAGAERYLVKPVRGRLLRESIAAVLAERPGALVALPPPAAPRDRPRRLLVADDNAVNLRLIEGFLAGTSCQLTFVKDGLEAVERFSEGRFDLVLMDVSMPRLDGYGAALRIRKIEAETATPRIPILCLTAHAWADHRERAVAHGMDAFLAKPIRKKTLIGAIDDWLGLVPVDVAS